MIGLPSRYVGVSIKLDDKGVSKRLSHLFEGCLRLRFCGVNARYILKPPALFKDIKVVQAAKLFVFGRQTV